MEECALQGLFTKSQRARFLDAVAQRKSVRTFVEPPDVAQLSALSFSAVRFRVPGVRLELSQADENKLYRAFPFVDTIVGSGHYAAIIIDKDAPHAALYAGACGEALALEAVSLELGTCWVAGTYKKSQVDIPLSEREKLVAILALGVPAKEKHKPMARKKLSEICVDDPTGWPLWAFEAAECVRMAPSALNRQPWQLSFAGRTMQLTKMPFADELSLGIALLHMSLGLKEREHVLRLGTGKQVATLYSEDRE